MKNIEDFRHPGWLQVVLEKYPKVFISPMREIGGMKATEQEISAQVHKAFEKKS